MPEFTKVGKLVLECITPSVTYNVNEDTYAHDIPDTINLGRIL